MELALENYYSNFVPFVLHADWLLGGYEPLPGSKRLVAVIYLVGLGNHCSNGIVERLLVSGSERLGCIFFNNAAGSNGVIRDLFPRPPRF